MDHVNNAVYLDWLEDAVLAAAVAAGEDARIDALPRRYRLEYAAAADAGMAVTDAVWREESGSWSYRLTAVDGPELFRAAIDPIGGRRMSRIVVRGGRIFDGTGADPAEGDVAIEDGRIVDVGTGLDGDEAIEIAGRTILPGLFDCHTHVTSIGVDPWANVRSRSPTSSTRRRGTSSRRCGRGSRPFATPAARTSASSRPSRTACIPGPRLQISIIMLSQTGGHGDDWYPSGARGPVRGGPPRPPVRGSSTASTRSGARSAS